MLIVIVGPTGSGKTSLAIKLADFYHAPIINADAFQIYDEMNIGTAKVEKDSEEYKKHYLLDIVKPNQTYSVKEYQEDFRKTYLELKKIYPTIIVCGGTGLYIRAALYDYVFEDEEEVDISDLEQLSNEELYEMLKQVDIKATETIHMNNRKRVIRALQIARTHAINKSENIDKQEHALFFKNEDVRFYFINPNREELYENINARVDQMFDNGLVDEVKRLLNKYELSLTAKAAIGYKEVIDYLEGKCTLEECKELIKKRTRNYAKRQVTFFKHQLPCKEFLNREELLKEAHMNKDIFARSIGLLGEETFNKVQNKIIAVYGLGGVGGTALEALARTGFKRFVIIDMDKVDPSNLNRQILYTSKDIGRNKVDAAKERILAINPEAEIQTFFGKAQDYDSNLPFDFIVDAIDDVDGKLFIAKKAQQLGIPAIMSLGMANRFNPEQVSISKLNQTRNDPLAKKIRYEAKKAGLDLSLINVVISEEIPQKNGEKLYSTMMVPSSAGLTIAKFILNSIIDIK